MTRFPTHPHTLAPQSPPFPPSPGVGVSVSHCDEGEVVAVWGSLDTLRRPFVIAVSGVAVVVEMIVVRVASRWEERKNVKNM